MTGERGRLAVVVGIAGGIAAYKAVGVARALVLAGHDVHVVATEAALRFVGRPTLEAISRNPVHSDLYEGVAEVRHVAIGQRADLIVVAPATANTIAKIAAGLADDLLGNTILASTAPLVLAPAMHTEMWLNPATQANVAVLRERGVTIVGPAEGQLTGADSGPGRMVEPDEIVAAALAALEGADAASTSRSNSTVDSDSRPHSQTREQDLAGKRIVVSAGGTREPLDPVRFLGNRSSGKQGVALARAAAERGADVVLVAAHLEVPVPDGVRVREVGTALELSEAMHDEAAEADAVIMAAAVADYRPSEVAERKIKKEQTGDTLALELLRNPDILTELAAAKRPEQLVVGFAAETESDRDRLLELGREKVARKGADYLVLNSVGWSDGFGADRNTVVVVSRAGDIVSEAAGSKDQVAHSILDLLS